MRLFLIPVLAIALASCANARLADEPADLVAPDGEMRDLLQMGWEISPPILATAPALPDPDDPSMSNGQSWASFTAKLAPGDELRPVTNNAGIGYAIFRGGELVDLFLTTIF